MGKNGIPDVNDIKNESEALDQSMALNRIVMALLQSQKETNKRLFIALILSLLCNLFIVGGFLWYESQWEYVTTETVTTTTVEQDTGEGTGNNVYQSGENATYSEGGAQ